MTKNYKPLKELCKEAGLKPIPFIPVSRELEAKIKREHGIKKRFLPPPPLDGAPRRLPWKNGVQ